MSNKPTHGITSVDHALRLAVLVRDEGPLRVSDVAVRLGVARSTAHRLLQMLVHHGFATQDEDRRYAVGPVLAGAGEPDPAEVLRGLAAPHLRLLADRVAETVNLQVVRHREAVFVDTVEAPQVLRVGDRRGRRLPAHLASGGRAVLAARADADVAALYADAAADVDVAALLRDLRRTRLRGYAVNNQHTEPGVTAIGRAVHRAGAATGAVSIAMPTARFRRDRLAEWVGELATTVSRIEAEIAAHGG